MGIEHAEMISEAVKGRTMTITRELLPGECVSARICPRCHVWIDGEDVSSRLYDLRRRDDVVEVMGYAEDENGQQPHTINGRDVAKFWREYHTKRVRIDLPEGVALAPDGRCLNADTTVRAERATSSETGGV